MKRKKKVIKIIVRTVGVLIILPFFILLILGIINRINREPEPEWRVEYRTPKDLSNIAGVQIPRAELIDSALVEWMPGLEWYIKAEFAIPEEDHHSLIHELEKQSGLPNSRWRHIVSELPKSRLERTVNEFSITIYPDYDDTDFSDGIDERKDEVEGELVDPWLGFYISLVVPKDKCRIMLKYGNRCFQ